MVRYNVQPYKPGVSNAMAHLRSNGVQTAGLEFGSGLEIMVVLGSLDLGPVDEQVRPSSFAPGLQI